MPRLVVLTALGVLGAVAATTVSGQQSSKPGSDDPVAFMADDEPAMRRAFDAARAGLDAFLQTARTRPPGFSDFAVKVGISDGKTTEYFWISDFSEREGSFVGRINNEPQLVKSVKFGEIYAFSKQQIVDWDVSRHYSQCNGG